MSKLEKALQIVTDELNLRQSVKARKSLGLDMAKAMRQAGITDDMITW